MGTTMNKAHIASGRVGHITRVLPSKVMLLDLVPLWVVFGVQCVFILDADIEGFINCSSVKISRIWVVISCTRLVTLVAIALHLLPGIRLTS